MSGRQCRLLPFHVAGGAWNMAADEILLEAATAGIASFRLYGWSTATLSLGYFQSAAAARGYPRLVELPWVRRASGGAALVHHHELTYALGLPTGSPWQKRGESWLKTMHVYIQQALAELGVFTRLCGDAEGKKRGEVLCFLHHTPGDLLIDDAKLAGSAQRKQRGALLQHGGILLAASPFTPLLLGIRELVDVAVQPSDLCAAVVAQLHRHTGWNLVSSEWDADERKRIDERAADKFAQSAWNDKR
jgi:lipoate-protein ligase A